MTRTGLRNVFFVLGLLAAVAALVLGNEERGNIPAAGAACGFGVSAGLCMIAAAIVAAAGLKGNQPGGRESERPEP